MIATDVKGNVTYLNTAAADVTGWSESEAIGQPLAVVFPIVNELTRSEAPRGFRDVLEARRKAMVTGARATGAALFAEKPKAWMKQLSPPVMAE